MNRLVLLRHALSCVIGRLKFVWKMRDKGGLAYASASKLLGIRWAFIWWFGVFFPWTWVYVLDAIREIALEAPEQLSAIVRNDISYFSMESSEV